MHSNRRDDGRISLETFYTEYVSDRPYRGMITNVSHNGLRVQRLLRPGARMSRVVQLEFELPGTQEVIWAKGEACFDELEIASFGPTGTGPSATLHSSGIRVVACADKHARLMRDYVIEKRRDNQRQFFQEAAEMLRNSRRLH
jgi:hypothetical protein